MSTKPAVINYTWDTQLLLDLLDTGIDWAARGLWAQLESYDHSKFLADPDDILSGPRPDLSDDEVLVRIRDWEEGEADEKDAPFVDVTLASLRKAANRALAEYKHLFTRVDREGFKVVDLDYDAIGADVILQFAVLGEVIYG